MQRLRSGGGVAAVGVAVVLAAGLVGCGGEPGRRAAEARSPSRTVDTELCLSNETFASLTVQWDATAAPEALPDRARRCRTAAPWTTATVLRSGAPLYRFRAGSDETWQQPRVEGTVLPDGAPVMRGAPSPGEGYDFMPGASGAYALTVFRDLDSGGTRRILLRLTRLRS